MTHKYQWAEDMIKEMTPDFGDEVTIESPSTTINGQDQPAAISRFTSPALITQAIKSRGDRQKVASRAVVTLPVTKYREPVPGDIFILPGGKRYTAELVSYLKPAGRSVAYEVQLSDR